MACTFSKETNEKFEITFLFLYLFLLFKKKQESSGDEQLNNSKLTLKGATSQGTPHPPSFTSSFIEPLIQGRSYPIYCFGLKKQPHFSVGTKA